MISICAGLHVEAAPAQETSSKSESTHAIASLEQLENEELRIRKDQNISRDEKLQKLRGIWLKQTNLEAKDRFRSLKTAPETNLVQSKQTTIVHSATEKSEQIKPVPKTYSNRIYRNPVESLISQSHVIISILHQRMYVIFGEKHFREYIISTSKYGIGDEFGSYKTPIGLFSVHSKIGDGLALGAVLKSRRPTKEVVAPNSKDRDPIVTRIIWLEGLESSNRHAFERCIYIHGTPKENDLGRPASYGCVRMASKDVVKVYEILPEQSRVAILERLDKGILKKFHYIEDKGRS